jgi:uncharacterized short protein YbdD (DUF466 family)
LIKSLKNLWARVRQLSGDDAYERYLQHYAEHHQSSSEDEAEPPLSKEAFFKELQDKKWTGVKRCC